MVGTNRTDCTNLTICFMYDTPGFAKAKPWRRPERLLTCAKRTKKIHLKPTNYFKYFKMIS